MTRERSRPAAIGLRLYRALARAFPYEFLSTYGDELLRTAEDAVEPVWRRHGISGLARLLADIAVRVPVEHVAEAWRDLLYGLRMLRNSPDPSSASRNKRRSLSALMGM